MNYEIIKDSKKLRCGYTTGSCAAAAAKAALLMLHTKKDLNSVYLITPNGLELTLPVFDITREENSVSCAIQKDAGDDPDVTDGMYIYAKVTLTDKVGGNTYLAANKADKGEQSEIMLRGGQGIGKVTKPGLDQPIGEAAINSIPRSMIKKEVLEVNEEYGYFGGVDIEIYAPEGEERARKTFNSQLGILGGISILGTTGIVEPMSDSAIIDTIRIELNQKKEEGIKRIIMTPGNYGEDFIRMSHEISPQFMIKCSNFIGEAFDFVTEMGFTDVCLVGHIGKLIKVAGGMLNTHSRYGDCRAEIFAANAAACGLPQKEVMEILESVTTEEMITIVKQYEKEYSTLLLDTLIQKLLEKIAYQLNRRVNQRVRIGVMTFSSKYGYLGETEGFSDIVSIIAV
ncbi:cobalt-precorrin-5B (C(1))-methyltransferase CbiD [Lachnoclostridium phytofermentans]|uniref:cobalt-precorrin-5B (C(1))-methyltransferase CbiD n=1 Tax=Lachnoclostridium phytofermentans TaxID=66219 RepID=UPI00049645F6|nr:cobalt-precorrin-5B (C(1))-methyltransferase CbiD [Lachnoclostridium phytofermentans]